MLRSMIVKASLIGATVIGAFYGGTQYTQANASLDSYYLVFEGKNYDTGKACTSVLSEYATRQLELYGGEVTDDQICVVTAYVPIDGVEQLPEVLGDNGLVGMFPTTDDQGNHVEFTVYLPQVSSSR